MTSNQKQTKAAKIHGQLPQSAKQSLFSSAASERFRSYFWSESFVEGALVARTVPVILMRVISAICGSSGSTVPATVTFREGRLAKAATL